MSTDTISQNQQNLDNNEFLSLQLLPPEQVEAGVRGVVELSKSSIANGIISFINYHRIITQTNHFISALNTNLVVGVQFLLYTVQIEWMKFYYDTNYNTERTVACSNENPIGSSGFYPPSNGIDEAAFDNPINEKLHCENYDLI